MREDSKKRKGQGGDEDSIPVREQVRKIIEGNTITIIMAITTLFALFGDDLRLWFSPKEADPYFYVALIISFFLFALELLVQSCVVDDFKYSFFFWLDFVATMSVFIDIQWFLDVLMILMDLPLQKYEQDVIPGQVSTAGNESPIGKILKSFRLIRLIRIIMLYNYAVKQNA